MTSNTNLNANLDVDGFTELDGLNVDGDTTLDKTTTDGLLDINAGGQANTFKVEDLTDNRVVIVGSGGELEDDANLTFDGNSLDVGVALNVDGITTLNSQQQSNDKDDGALVVEGGVGIEKNLNVGENTKLTVRNSENLIMH